LGNSGPNIDHLVIVPLEVDQQVFEAETAALNNATPQSLHPGASGGAYADFVDGEEGAIEWGFRLLATGVYSLEFRYALAQGDRPLTISHVINGPDGASLIQRRFSFPATGSFDNWKSVSVVTELKSGDHIIRVETAGNSGPNIDKLTVMPALFLTQGGDIVPRPDEPEFGQPGYSETYYGIVDPAGERRTLTDWKRVNGFISGGFVVNAKYINAHDLGFGRDMYCRDNGRSSCYVDNYLDPKGEKEGAERGPKFATTVTMERMNLFNSIVTAFFVYDTNGHRVNQLALDSEGPKAVPESCYACHKGYTSAGGNPVGGQYLPWDIDLLEDWPGRPKKNDQLDAFRQLNRIVWRDASLPYQRQILNPSTNPPTVVRKETTARKVSLVELIEGWYDGPPFIDHSFVGDRLPKLTWFDSDIQSGACDVVQTPRGFELVNAEKCNRFARQRFLYKNVYATSCRSCHVAEGPTQDVNENFDGLDWTEAAVFHDQAYYQICDSPTSLTMPHAELTFDRFNNDVITTTDGRAATAKDRLCGEPLPDGFVRNNRANKDTGKMVFDSKGCNGCHTIQGGGFPKPDLTCKGARVFKNLGKINAQFMSPYTLTDQEVADVRKYLDSFPQCQ
jgi:mono/diheme cytochrome c family protein